MLRTSIFLLFVVVSSSVVFGYDIVCFDHVLNLSVNMTVVNISNTSNQTNTSVNISMNTSNSTNTTILNETNTTILDCLHNFSIQTEDVHQAGESISYKPIAEPTPENFTIEYWWEDYYNVSVKDVRTTANLNSKSYTPKLDNVAEKLFYIKMNLLTCNMTFFAQKLVVVTGGEVIEEEINEESTTSSSTSTTTVQESKETLKAIAPLQAEQNESIEVLATIYNEGYTTELFFIWSYVYSGSVNKTPREDIQEVLVQARSEEFTTLTLPGVQDTGNFSLKTQVLKPGRKTPYEVRQEIEILEPVLEEFIVSEENTSLQQTPVEENGAQKENISIETPAIAGFAVYEQTMPEKFFKNGAWVSVVLAGILFGIAKLSNRFQNDAHEKQNP